MPSTDAIFEVIREFRRKLWAPPSTQSVSDWCSEHCYLDGRQAEQEGYVSFHLRPYMIEWLENLADPSVSEQTICTGVQVGKSTAMMLGMAWSLVHAPSPSMWVGPTRELVSSFSKSRWIPLVERCAPLMLEMPTNRHKFTIFEQNFQRSVLAFTASNSASQLAARPCGRLWLDELNKFPKGGKGGMMDEANAVQLAEDRTREFNFSKIWRSSTPTTAGGPITSKFNEGDQRYFFAPCPACKHFQVLKWPNVRWETFKLKDGSYDFPKIGASAHIRCVSCGFAIRDEHKLSMLSKGAWRPTNPSAPSYHRSYHLSRLYSLSVKSALPVLVRQFLTDINSLDGIRNFVNSTLAEVFIGDDDHSHRERVELISPPDAAPLEDSVRLLTCDVQLVAPLRWVIVREWAKHGHSRLLGAFHCEDFEAVRRIQQHYGIPDNRVVIDAGFDQANVLLACLAHTKLVQRNAALPLAIGWCPAKGTARPGYWTDKTGKHPSAYFYSQAPTDPTLRVHLPMLNHLSDHFLDLLARLRRGPEKCGGTKWEVCELPAVVDIPGVFSVDAETYWAQMDSMKKKPFPNPKTGRVDWRWAKTNSARQNHLLDMESLQLVWAYCHRHGPSALPLKDPEPGQTAESPAPEAEVVATA